MNTWAEAAKSHWKRHRPASYAALADPQRYFEELGEEASERYVAIRDGLLAGISPNDGTTGWETFQSRVAQADQEARAIVEREMIYTAPSPEDETATS